MTARLRRSVMVSVVILAIAVAMWTGITRQGDIQTYPGQPDRGDAYSEQIVRNTG